MDQSARILQTHSLTFCSHQRTAWRHITAHADLTLRSQQATNVSLHMFTIQFSTSPAKHSKHRKLLYEKHFLVVARHTFYVTCHSCVTNRLCSKKKKKVMPFSIGIVQSYNWAESSRAILAPTNVSEDTSSRVMDIQLAAQDS